MNEEDFVKLAEECGYTNEEIKDFINFHKETGIPYSDMQLLEHRVD